MDWMDILDKVLFVAFIVLVLFWLSQTTSNPTEQQICEAKGGRIVYDMKSYHHCKLNVER